MALEIRAVHKVFGSVEILSGINLTVGAGECVVVLGPSGCGKSTLLRIIAGLEPQDAGEVSCNGRDFADLPPRSRNVALVFQHYALYEQKSVFANIAYPLQLRGLSKREVSERVASILADLDLTPLSQRHPSKLSGGEQQRVALGRALVRQPDAFLLDEPLSSLDPSLRQGLRRQLQQVYRSLHVPTLHVTHDQEEAVLLGDRIALLLDGKIQQCASVSELVDRPATIEVARFLGSPTINLLRCPIQLVGDYPAAILTPDLILARGFRIGDEAGRHVICGVRPWDITFSDSGVPGRVLSRRLVPPHLRFEIELPDSATDTEAITVLALEKVDYFEGDSVSLLFQRDRLLWFDEITGHLLRPLEGSNGL